MTPVPGLDAEMPGRDRLFALLVPAITELVREAGLLRAHLRSCALLLSLPEASPATEAWGLGEGLGAELCARLGLSPSTMRVCQWGHAGVLALLRDAGAMLQSGAALRCIVAGADSYLDHRRLAALDEAYRLRSRRGVDGFTPGKEALGVARRDLRRRAPPRGRRARDRRERGRGHRAAHASRPGSELGPRSHLRDPRRPPAAGPPLLGLRHQRRELPLVRVGPRARAPRRAHRGHGRAPSCRLPARATSGPPPAGSSVASAMAAFRRGHAPPGDAIVWASSAGGLRAAVRLARPS